MKSQMTFSSAKAKKESLEKINKRIVQIETKIKSINEKINENKICPILDETQHPCVALCCNTKYCGECISKWLATSIQCPFCRTSITNKSLVYIQDTEGEIEIPEDKLPTKIEYLKKIINSKKDNPDFKMLIFSDFSNSFDLLNYFLIQRV